MYRNIPSSVKNSAHMALTRSSLPTCGPTTSSCVTCTPGSLESRAHLARILLRIGRQADGDVVRGAEALHLRLAETGSSELVAHRVDVGRMRETDLGADTTREVDTVIQATDEERAERYEQQYGRETVPHPPRGHEREVGLVAEEFHLLSLCSSRCGAQIDRRAILRWPPYMRVSSARLP